VEEAVRVERANWAWYGNNTYVSGGVTCLLRPVSNRIASFAQQKHTEYLSVDRRSTRIVLEHATLKWKGVEECTIS